MFQNQTEEKYSTKDILRVLILLFSMWEPVKVIATFGMWGLQEGVPTRLRHVFIITLSTIADEGTVNNMMLFSDGCAGQNKNSTLPTMARHFLRHSKSIQGVRFHNFETNHGQSESDSIHSVIESALNRIQTVLVPSEIVGILRAAARQSLIWCMR